jgi:aryl-alcohol dehydrogenase-like predicted oxidoreductase
VEKRELGRTTHMSSVVTFGGAALWKCTQGEADRAIELAIQHGVNHFDVAPSYGEAESRLGPWMEKHQKEIFLGCKTQERSKRGAWESIKRSLDRLRVDYFDLFQLHAVDDIETLNVVLSPVGALEAVQEAKQQGLVKFIGITGHRPFTHVEALSRFDFDTVLFPLNRIMASRRNDFSDFRPLLELVKQKNVGTLAIKSVAKRPWEGTMHMYKTWYEPFDEQEDIDKSLWFTLSQGVTTAPMPGDLSLWPMVLSAAERYKPMTRDQEREAVDKVKNYKHLFER